MPLNGGYPPTIEELFLLQAKSGGTVGYVMLGHTHTLMFILIMCRCQCQCECKLCIHQHFSVEPWLSCSWVTSRSQISDSRQSTAKQSVEVFRWQSLHTSVYKKILLNHGFWTILLQTYQYDHYVCFVFRFKKMSLAFCMWICFQQWGWWKLSMGYMEDFRVMAVAVILRSCLRSHDVDIGRSLICNTLFESIWDQCFLNVFGSDSFVLCSCSTWQLFKQDAKVWKCNEEYLSRERL